MCTVFVLYTAIIVERAGNMTTTPKTGTKVDWLSNVPRTKIAVQLSQQELCHFLCFMSLNMLVSANVAY
jgi:hypothetical protein